MEDAGYIARNAGRSAAARNAQNGNGPVNEEFTGPFVGFGSGFVHAAENQLSFTQRTEQRHEAANEPVYP